MMYVLLSLIFSANAECLDGKLIAGAYSSPRTISISNGMSEPEQMEIDSVLELVPYEKGSLYFRTKFYHDNAHRCDLSGIATIEGESLVYSRSGTKCVFKIHFSKDKITYEDKDKACESVAMCGRHGFEFEEFSRKKRRKITYMQRLQGSPEYKAAVEEFKKAAASK